MDFDKIYADFEAARTSDDFDTMSDIIAAVNEHCNVMIQSGRGNEIPPRDLRIAEHVNVLIHRVTKLLSDGDGVRAKNYLISLARDNVSTFDKFFHMMYLLARGLYVTGNFAQAAKIFDRYDQIRAAHWDDADELSLFYRANCLMLTGDFDAAIPFYERALAMKADFPEAKRNLKLARQRSIENLAREVKSLWNFPNWRDVPIFINARDRLGVMRRQIDWLLDAGYRKIFVLDNASTYPPLLEYYAALETDRRVKIIRLEKNFGFKALWLSNILERLNIATPYVYTDPDVVPAEDCPKDFLKRLMEILGDNHEIRKVGLGLVWEDITFFQSDRMKKIESDYYDGSRVGDELYFTQVDTTFALYANVRHYSVRLAMRTAGDLRARHLPWYFDYDNLPDDERYYIAHAENFSSTVNQFRNRKA
ncbi:MAG: tetratricopeptide repeat protein [Quinella sp. 2Q5]|nr:tetratricopeptide repeat protein [Quinella sp. 2Q5]